MAASQKQVEANRRNAKKSTGPVTPIGKAKSARNSVRHGLFSTQVVLPHENEDEYLALKDELAETLKPVGAVEQMLVDKIALCIWRQQRLAHAEAARLSIQTQAKHIAKGVTEAMYDYPSLKSVSEEDLGPVDQEYEQWCAQILTELEIIDVVGINGWRDLETLAPSIYKGLQHDASEEDGNITDSDSLNLLDVDVTKYLEQIRAHYSAELEKLKQKPLIQQMAKWVQAKDSISFGETERLFSRYQTSLDNELYKALKALREQQKFRMSTIDGDAVKVDEE
jgi:uncharacterized protein YktA (UPF0223 family)